MWLLFPASRSSERKGKDPIPGPLDSMVTTMGRNRGVAILGVALDLAVPAYWNSPRSSQPAEARDLCDMPVGQVVKS